MKSEATSTLTSTGRHLADLGNLDQRVTLLAKANRLPAQLFLRGRVELAGIGGRHE